MFRRPLCQDILGFLFITLIFFSSFFANTASSYEKIPIAVLDLEAKGDASQSTAEALTALMSNDLFNTDRFDIAERERIKQIMEEHSLQMTGYTDYEQTVELGKKLNVEKMVTGELTKIGSKYIITVRLIDVMAGKVDVADKEECKCAEDELTDLIENLSKRIANAIPLRGSIIRIKGNDIYIDLGNSHGIEEEMFMNVIRRGEPIRDLEGNIIGIDEEEIGVIEVTKTQPQFSIAIPVGTPDKELQKGDWVSGKVSQEKIRETQKEEEEKQREKEERERKEEKEAKRKEEEEKRDKKDDDDEDTYTPPPAF